MLTCPSCRRLMSLQSCEAGPLLDKEETAAFDDDRWDQDCLMIIAKSESGLAC